MQINELVDFLERVLPEMEKVGERLPTLEINSSEMLIMLMIATGNGLTGAEYSVWHDGLMGIINIFWNKE